MSKTPSKALVKAANSDLEIMPEVIYAQLGAELTTLYHEAEDGFRRVLRFGAAFLRVEQIVNGTRAVNSPKRGPGAYGFANWLRDHAPEISERSAIRYRDITEALCGKFKIADPERVFAADAATLPEADQAKRAKALDFVAEKSLRQVQLELDLVSAKPSESPMRAVRKQAEAKTPEQKDAEFIAAARATALQTMIAFDELDDRWQLLNDAQIKLAADNAERFAKLARAWVELPPARRALFDSKRHLEGKAEQALADRRAEGRALASVPNA